MKELTGSNNVAVLDHDALWCACRSRSVHDTREIVSLGRDGLGRVLIAQLQQLIEADDLQMRMRARERINVFLLRVILGAVDDDLDVLGFLHGIYELGQELWVSEHDFCFRLEHRVP